MLQLVPYMNASSDTPTYSLARLPLNRCYLKKEKKKKTKPKRLAFVHKFKCRTTQKGKRICFSDDRTFRSITASNFPEGNIRFDPRYTVKGIKYPSSVMVRSIWG